MRYIYIMILSLLIFGCSIKKQHIVTPNIEEQKTEEQSIQEEGTKKTSCDFGSYTKSNDDIQDANWVCDPDHETDAKVYIAEVGQSVLENSDSFGFKVQLAVNSAREKLLYKIKDNLKNYIIKTSNILKIDPTKAEELLYNTSNTIMLDNLKTSKIYKQLVLDNKNIFLLVGYIKDDYMDYIKKIIRNNYIQNKSDWNKMLGEKSIDDFESEVLKSLL